MSTVFIILRKIRFKVYIETVSIIKINNNNYLLLGYNSRLKLNYYFERGYVLFQKVDFTTLLDPFNITPK